MLIREIYVQSIKISIVDSIKVYFIQYKHILFKTNVIYFTDKYFSKNLRGIDNKFNIVLSVNSKHRTGQGLNINTNIAPCSTAVSLSIYSVSTNIYISRALTN